MASGSVSNSSQVSTITGSCVVAQAKFGSNYDSSGTPEVYVGSGAGDDTTRREWDSNPSNGIDSGQVSVFFSAEVGGGSNGIAWSVSSSDAVPIIYTGRTYGAIQSVKIRAAVGLNGSSEWTELQVKFFRSGRLLESFPASGYTMVGG